MRRGEGGGVGKRGRGLGMSRRRSILQKCSEEVVEVGGLV